MEFWIDVLGWIGSAEVIAAYALNSYKKIDAESPSYLFLNITGAFFLVLYSVHHGAFANALVNIIWTIIALPLIFKVLKKNQWKFF